MIDRKMRRNTVQCWANRSLVVIVSGLLAMGVASRAALAQSNTSAGVGVLIDSSKAMGQKVGGLSKAALAGNALANNFVKHDSRLNMSLAVFGHLKRDGCSAVDVVQDLEPLRAATFAKALVDLKTVGAAPLALALETMATSLAEEANVRRIIVVTTSADNCKGDPCKVATRIRRRQPNLKVDIIGIGSQSSKVLNSLKCVAERTGGSFSIHSSESNLTNAIDVAIETASVPDAAVPEFGSTEVIPGTSVSGLTGQDDQAGLDGSGSWSTEAISPIPKPSSGPTDGLGTIRLVAMLTDNQKPIPAGLTWRVFSTTKNSNGQYRLVSEQRTWSPVLELPKGEYLVNAAYGRAHLTRLITVAPGAPRVEPFILQAGGLRLRAMNALGEPVRGNVSYSVRSGDRDQYGNRRTIIANVKPGLIIRLNAGIYNVVSRYGDANAVVEADVTVEPGKLTQIAMTHSGGKATFKLVAKRGGEAIAGTLWSIRTLNGIEVKKSQGALPSHILAPGEYKVLAQQGDRTFTGQFNISANANKQIEIVMK